MQPTEYYSLSAHVLGTLATYNDTIDKHRQDPINSNSSFWRYHSSANGVVTSYIASINYNVDILTEKTISSTISDSSWCILGLFNNSENANSAFPATARLFNVVRQDCIGHWQITKSSVQLVNGDCNAALGNSSHNPQLQKIFTEMSLSLTSIYPATLKELLAPFAVDRRSSEWYMPTLAVTVANM